MRAMRIRPFKRVAIGVAALTMLFAGSAFTAGNTMTAVDGGVVGHGTTTVSGATVLALDYTLDANGENVTAVALQLEGDQSGSTAAIGFNGGATTDCAAGTYTTATDFTCTVTTATSGLVSTEVVVN